SSFLRALGIVAAYLATTTTRPEEVLSRSSLKGGEGRGEEVISVEFPSPPSSAAVLLRRTGRPSPHSFLAGRGRRFLMVAARCARLVEELKSGSVEGYCPFTSFPLPTSHGPTIQRLNASAI